MEILVSVSNFRFCYLSMFSFTHILLSFYHVYNMFYMYNIRCININMTYSLSLWCSQFRMGKRSSQTSIEQYIHIVCCCISSILHLSNWQSQNSKLGNLSGVCRLRHFTLLQVVMISFHFCVWEKDGVIRKNRKLRKKVP